MILTSEPSPAKIDRRQRSARRQNWSARKGILSSCFTELSVAAFEAFVARDVAWRTHLRREERLKLAGCVQKPTHWKIVSFAIFVQSRLNTSPLGNAQEKRRKGIVPVFRFSTALFGITREVRCRNHTSVRDTVG